MQILQCNRTILLKTCLDIYPSIFFLVITALFLFLFFELCCLLCSCLLSACTMLWEHIMAMKDMSCRPLLFLEVMIIISGSEPGTVVIWHAMIGQEVLPPPLSTNCHHCLSEIPGFFHVTLLFNCSVERGEVSHLFSSSVFSLYVPFKIADPTFSAPRPGFM